MKRKAVGKWPRKTIPIPRNFIYLQRNKRFTNLDEAIGSGKSGHALTSLPEIDWFRPPVTRRK